MYITNLKLYIDGDVKQSIDFHLGLNIITDETNSKQDRGNNVGKTTALRVIAYCLGGNFITSEQAAPVQELLYNHEVTAEATLRADWDDAATETVIGRHLSPADMHGKAILDGRTHELKQLDTHIKRILDPALAGKAPELKDLMKHNMRLTAKQQATLLNVAGNDTMKEMLCLFMLGCDTSYAEDCIRLDKDIKSKTLRLDELKKSGDHRQIGTLIAMEEQVERNCNDAILHAAADKRLADKVRDLDTVKARINSQATLLSQLETERGILQETIEAKRSETFSHDLSQLRAIYDETLGMGIPVHRTFEELVGFHNRRIAEQEGFIAAELKEKEKAIAENRAYLDMLLEDESRLAARVKRQPLFAALNKKYEEMGVAKAKKEQLEEQDRTLTRQEEAIEQSRQLIAERRAELYSDDYHTALQARLNSFNGILKSVTQEIYGTTVQMTVKKEGVNSAQHYVFDTTNQGNSHGDRLGLAICHDVAYTRFATASHVPCMHFMLYDLYDSIDPNLLMPLHRKAAEAKAQCIMAVMRDKLTSLPSIDPLVCLKLSADKKFFGV